jgi:hypothetical protein
LTKFLTVTVKKSLKDETEKLGIDLGEAVEQLPGELVSDKKLKAQTIAKDSVA